MSRIRLSERRVRELIRRVLREAKPDSSKSDTGLPFDQPTYGEPSITDKAKGTVADVKTTIDDTIETGKEKLSNFTASWEKILKATDFDRDIIPVFPDNPSKHITISFPFRNFGDVELTITHKFYNKERDAYIGLIPLGQANDIVDGLVDALDYGFTGGGGITSRVAGQLGWKQDFETIIEVFNVLWFFSKGMRPQEVSTLKLGSIPPEGFKAGEEWLTGQVPEEDLDLMEPVTALTWSGKTSVSPSNLNQQLKDAEIFGSSLCFMPTYKSNEVKYGVKYLIELYDDHEGFKAWYAGNETILDALQDINSAYKAPTTQELVKTCIRIVKEADKIQQVIDIAWGKWMTFAREAAKWAADYDEPGK